ncbi:hypothetical protein Dimus_013921 [Dionaea muscipula]
MAAQDDLIIFAKADMPSIAAVLQAIQTFSASSGLKVSIAKTSFFAAGVNEQRINDIQRLTGFNKEHGLLVGELSSISGEMLPAHEEGIRTMEPDEGLLGHEGELAICENLRNSPLPAIGTRSCC